MFKIGDKIMYGQTGVCIVEDICEKALIKNQTKLYYILKPVFQQNNVIYAPADSDKVFMRQIISKQQADEIIGSIPDIMNKLPNKEMSQEEYKVELATHDCRDLVSLTAKIYKKKQNAKLSNKKLGFSDEKYMKLAESLLFGELSVALDIKYEDVIDYIDSKIKQAKK